MTDRQHRAAHHPVSANGVGQRGVDTGWPGACPDQCGECCTYMLLPVPVPLLTEDYIRWLTLHGCTVEYKYGRFHVRVPVKCGELLIGAGGAMRCAIYGERPELCRVYECAKERP